MKWVLLTVVFVGNQPPVVTQISFPNEKLCSQARASLGSGLPKGGDWSSVRIGGSCLQVADY